MKCLVLLSGGISSAIVAARAVAEFREVEAITFAYGDAHRERAASASRAIAEFLGIPRKLIGIGPVLTPTVEPGDYNAAWTPGRNLFFLSLAFNRARAIGANSVGVGFHRGDAEAGFPDCRTAFLDSAFTASREGGVPLAAYAPLAGMAQSETVGELSVVPYAMPAAALSWTCRYDGYSQCRRCEPCVDRKRAFEAYNRRAKISKRGSILDPAF
jgi:7-cyano-7-deazaguanine synthase